MLKPLAFALWRFVFLHLAMTFEQSIVKRLRLGDILEESSQFSELFRDEMRCILQRLSRRMESLAQEFGSFSNLYHLGELGAPHGSCAGLRGQIP